MKHYIKIRRFEKNLNKPLRASSSITMDVVINLISRFGKNALKAIKLYLYIKLHDGGFVNISKKKFEADLQKSMSEKYIDKMLIEFENMGLVKLHRNDSISRKTIQYFSKEELFNTFEPFSSQFKFSNKYITIQKETILSDIFGNYFFTKLFQNLSIHLFNRNAEKKFNLCRKTFNKDYDNLTKSQQLKYRNQFTQILRENHQLIQGQINAAESKQKSARINKCANSLDEFLKNQISQIPNYMQLALGFITKVANKKSKQTASNWLEFANQYSFFSRTKVFYVFKGVHPEVQKIIQNEYSHLYGRLKFTKKFVYFKMPDYINFSEADQINTIEFKTLKYWKNKVLSAKKIK